jgi:hypothetical protein
LKNWSQIYESSVLAVGNVKNWIRVKFKYLECLVSIRNKIVVQIYVGNYRWVGPDFFGLGSGFILCARAFSGFEKWLNGLCWGLHKLT